MQKITLFCFFMIAKKIIQLVLPLIQPYSQLSIALSGGLDSVVLLHVLKTIQRDHLPDLKLQAIHVHHGLSQNADDWQAHCAALCQMLNVPLQTLKVHIEKRSNLEAQARKARYQAFQSILDSNAVLCTAQHLDDQIETFFLALKRGSGLNGLCAMPEKHQNYGFTLLRPFLPLSRRELENYAQKNALSWIEDESNQDLHYDRNFLRHQILPKLNQRWAHFSEMAARAISHCQNENLLLKQLLTQQLDAMINAQNGLNIAPLFEKNDNERNALLRLWLEISKLPALTQAQLKQLWQTIACAKEDANPKLIIESHQFRRFKQYLYGLPIYQDLTLFYCDWDLTALILPDSVGILRIIHKQNCRLPQAHERVLVRFSAESKPYSIVGRSHARSLKKIWQEKNIAPWQRARIPLIFYNETLICAVGVFVTQEGAGNAIGFALDKK